MKLKHVQFLAKEIKGIKSLLVGIRDVYPEAYEEFSAKLAKIENAPESSYAKDASFEEYSERIRKLVFLQSDIESIIKDKALPSVISKNSENLVKQLAELGNEKDLSKFEKKLDVLIENYRIMANNTNSVLSLENREKIETQIAKELYYLIKNKYMEGAPVDLKKLLPDEYKTSVYLLFEDDILNLKNTSAEEAYFLLKEKTAPKADLADESERIYIESLWQMLAVGMQLKHNLITEPQFNNRILELLQPAPIVAKEFDQKSKNNQGEKPPTKGIFSFFEKKRKDILSLPEARKEDIKETFIEDCKISGINMTVEEEKLEIPSKISDAEIIELVSKGANEEEIRAYNAYISDLQKKENEKKQNIELAKKNLEENGFSPLDLQKLKIGDKFLHRGYDCTCTKTNEFEFPVVWNDEFKYPQEWHHDRFVFVGDEIKLNSFVKLLFETDLKNYYREGFYGLCETSSAFQKNILTKLKKLISIDEKNGDFGRRKTLDCEAKYIKTLSAKFPENKLFIENLFDHCHSYYASYKGETGDYLEVLSMYKNIKNEYEKLILQLRNAESEYEIFVKNELPPKCRFAVYRRESLCKSVNNMKNPLGSQLENAPENDKKTSQSFITIPQVKEINPAVDEKTQQEVLCSIMGMPNEKHVKASIPIVAKSKSDSKQLCR